MYIELKADDMMPWGKYQGYTLRGVYKKDLPFYKKICSQSDSYKISQTTRKIIENDLPATEHSVLSFSLQKGNKTELKYNDVLTGGPFKGKTLLDVFMQNESYYRYLCDHSVYYISKKTFDFFVHSKKGDCKKRRGNKAEEREFQKDGYFYGFCRFRKTKNAEEGRLR